MLFKAVLGHLEQNIFFDVHPWFCGYKGELQVILWVAAWLKT